MRRPSTTMTHFHHRQAIVLLNQSLSDSTISLHDSTIAIVTIFAVAASSLDDYAAMNAHIAGL